MARRVGKAGSASSARVESVSISLDDLRAAAEAIKPPAGWWSTRQVADALGRSNASDTAGRLRKLGAKEYRTREGRQSYWRPDDVMELVKGGNL
jgi:hypothetical protein